MRGHEEKAAVLQGCLAEGQSLTGLVEYSDGAIVSKTMFDKPAGTITLFAFDAGQKLSEHTAPYDAVVQVTEGAGRLTIGGEDTVVTAGQIIVMPARVPHAVAADEPFKMMLTMIRA